MKGGLSWMTKKNWNELAHFFMGTIFLVYIYMYVQKNEWQPPEAKCHVLRRRRGTRALVTA